MISCEVGYFGVTPRLLFNFRGSPIPRALLWSTPCGLLGMALFFHWRGEDRGARDSVSHAWSGYTFVLGFMICLRLQHAYDRFWEAATLTNEIRAEWLHAVSCLVAFCTNDEAKAEEVRRFQHLLARLVSMLHEAALERLNLWQAEPDDCGHEGLEADAMAYLGQTRCKTEVLCQWILRLIYNALKGQVVDAPAPVVSPVVQEISQGMVKLNNVEKIVRLPVPFPYVQMNVVLLLFHWMITPVISALIMPNWRWAGGVAFSSVFFLWSIYFISMELEVPFGGHTNSLPSARMQAQLDECLKALLQERAQTPPSFVLRGEGRRLSVLVRESLDKKRDFRASPKSKVGSNDADSYAKCRATV